MSKSNFHVHFMSEQDNNPMIDAKVVKLLAKMTSNDLSEPTPKKQSKTPQSQKNWMANHHEKQLEYYKNWNKTHRDRIYQLIGGTCACCGNKYYANLHQHKQTKTHKLYDQLSQIK